MTLHVRQGSPAEWKEILAASHTAFNVDRTYFPKGWPHTYPDPGAAEWFVVCEDAGRIIGVINQTPVALRIAGVRLKAVGIGGVGVLPDARKHGAMSAMLRASNAWQNHAGTVLGFLGGERIRYRRYGYELAGQRVTAMITHKQLADAKPVRMRRLTRKDAAGVLRLYRRSPLWVGRDVVWQERLLRRSNFVAYGNASGPLRAYLVIGKGAPQGVHELVGEAHLLPGLLKAHLHRWKLGSIQCAWIPEYAPHAELGRNAGWMSSNAAQQVRLFDFGRFLRQMAGPLGAGFRRFRVAGAVRVRHRDEGTCFDLTLDRTGVLSVAPAQGKGRPDLAMDAAGWVRTFFPPPGGPMLPHRADARLLAAMALPLNFSAWDSL